MVGSGDLDSGLGLPIQVSGLRGARIVMLVGAHVLFQFDERWIGYRLTPEAPNQERHLHQARAGGHQSEGRDRLQTERVMQLLTGEVPTQ